ncbi:MAG: DUF3619 family protein [Formosimonas sp.]
MNHENTARAIALTRQVLDHGVEQLPYDITERLRAARTRALSAQKNKPILSVSTGFWGWLQRMPTLAQSLVAVPVLAGALLIGTQIYNPASDDSIPAPMALMQISNEEPLNIDAILDEKIPLQAYLNDDFNRFVAQNNHR